MFACVFAPGIQAAHYPRLIEFASHFSPLLEETSPDSVIIDLRGCEWLHGPAPDFCRRITASARDLHFIIKTAVAGNPDAAYHAARGPESCLFVEPGREEEFLGSLPVEILNPEFAGISEERFQEIVATLHSWGIYSFRELTAIPAPGLSERLGPEGVQIQKLATGRSNRSILVRDFERTYSRHQDIEDPIALHEALLLTFSRMVKQIHEDLEKRNLGATGLQLRMQLTDGRSESREIEFPTAIREIKTLDKILDLQISAFPPAAPVTQAGVTIYPGRIRAIQSGLFIPGAPEAEKTGMVLARIEKMIGRGKIGSPEIRDSHHPDAFRLRQFDPRAGFRKPEDHPVAFEDGYAMRVLRPALKASVWFEGNQPVRIHAPGGKIREGISGNIFTAAGPWKISGDWWSDHVWSREEWDLQLSDGTVCRMYRDLMADAWYVDGILD